LIVHYDGIDQQFVAARDKITGEVAWKVKRSGKLPDKAEFQKAYATPHVIEEDDRSQLISPASDWVYSYDPATGKELWRANYGQLGFSTVPRPVVGNGMVYIITSFMQSRLLAVKYDGQGDVSKTHVVWNSDRQVPKKPSALLAGQELYLISDNGVGTCLDALSGDVLWTERLGGQYSASPLLADGRIYAFSQEGKTVVFEPGKEYKALAENQLDAGFMASPAVTGKALFLRTETHLYRVEEK
jgi:outer membrane protein assembly factor BamB